MDGDGSDLLEWMVSEEVHVRAIRDGGMSSRCHWWTHGVALVRLWDSGHRSTRERTRTTLLHKRSRLWAWRWSGGWTV
jgi:hypothetical protein